MRFWSVPKYGFGVHRRQVTGMGRERKMDGECAGALAQHESMPGTPSTPTLIPKTAEPKIVWSLLVGVPEIEIWGGAPPQGPPGRGVRSSEKGG